MSTMPSDIECVVFEALCSKIGTPVAYKASLALKRSDWTYLATMKVQVAGYTCAKTFLEDSQIAAFFKKYPGFDLGIDLKAKAVTSFYECEAVCYQTNERLNPLLDDLGHYGARVRQFITVWRKKVRNAIGRAPVGESLNRFARFGPGSTFQNVGDEITIAHKLSDSYTTTQQAKTFLHLWDQTAWSRYAACSLDTVGDISVAERQGLSLYQGDSGIYAIRDFEEVRGNRFTTVPKDSSKHRGICIEPSLNVFYQLAVGQCLSERMKERIGWDKSDCQEHHKLLARLGSLTGAIATIDLSNASDTVCRNLVELLLPPDWFALVARLRSTHTFIEGKWVLLEKFSSMGNGFTFELETLLFRTLCDAVAELDPPTEDAYTPGLTISVFGDDIVVPSSISSSVVSSLKFFGFTTNKSKTFLTGSFRESCGGDYFAGHDVRPHFQKEVCDAPHRLIALANGIRRFGCRHDDLGGSSAYRIAWFRCLDAIPRQIRICRGPASLGDLVIHDERWESINPIATRHSIRYLRVWRPVPNRVIGWDNWRPGVVLAAALYGASSGALPYTPTADPEDIYRRGGVVPRVSGSYVSGYRLGRVAYS
jgi:hypothetical protein